MEPILWIAFYLVAWALLAVWTVIKSNQIGRHFDPHSPAYAFIPRRGATVRR